MKRNTLIYMLGSFVVGGVVGAIAGIFLFIRIVGGSSEASAPISAPTLVPAAQEIVEADSASTAKVFRIVPEESEVFFKVREVDPPVIAVGSTKEVAGDILVDFNQPAGSQIGTIRINLRTLVTDEPARDHAIRSVVLLTSRPEYEFSDFVPTGITGLPDSVQAGDTLNFQVTGDFPLKGITRSLTFDVVLEVVSESELRGEATTIVNRTDYNLLADALISHGVDEAVTLEFQFVAREVVE